MRPTANQLGIAFSLLALSFFFGALIIAFAFGISSQREWRRFDMPSLLWVSTLLIAGSSQTLEAGRRALRRAQIASYRRRIAATLTFSVLFLVVQAAAALELLRAGIAAEANPHGSVFYVFIGIHGTHLLGGQIWLAAQYRRSRALFRAGENELRRHRAGVQILAVYWHFMGVLWLVMFALLHLWTRG